MSSKERTENSKDGDRKEAGDLNVPDSPSTSDNSSSGLSRVPPSPTCRKIFFDDNFTAVPFLEASKDMMEQQKLKWNFNFQTETPLEGRYLWIRTEESSGYYKNGKGLISEKSTCQNENQKKVPKRPHRSASLEPEETKDGETGVSCDTALNEPQESPRKSLRFNEPHLGVDWT